MGDPTMAVAMAALLLLLSSWSPAVTGHRGGDWDPVPGGGGEAAGSRGLFILDKSETVVKTDGGEVRVVRGFRSRDQPQPMHIGFITMEPNTLFIPQYLDANLIIFVRRGEVKIGWIYKDEMVEKQLKPGDINRIPAGSTFYMVNTGKGQRLQIICAIDTSESIGWSLYQSFFIGGGQYPTSVLAGFDVPTLATAFNVTAQELHTILSSPVAGPIVYVTDSHAADRPGRLASIMDSKLKEMHKRAVGYNAWDEEDEERREEREEERTWTWRKLLNSVLLGAREDDRRTGKKGGAVLAPDSYNLYDREPGYKNKYGWSIALDERDYEPLKKSDVGVYLVNLTAGSMMAPHVNPTATEYGVVVAGSGTIQVVFPNGTAAMNAEVQEGDVFWIPRYFPFCHVASRSGPMEFFGFTTSARPNRPQFLAGARSVLRSMAGPELAAGFGISEDRLDKFLGKQDYDVILPPWPPAAERVGEEEPFLIKTRVDV